MALIDVLPPSVRPCGKYMRRLSKCLCGTVSNLQLTLGLVSFVKPTGRWISGDQSGGPASSNRTWCAGFALSRFATTHPAAPAPTTTYVYRLAVMRKAPLPTRSHVTRWCLRRVLSLRDRHALHLPVVMQGLDALFPPVPAVLNPPNGVCPAPVVHVLTARGAKTFSRRHSASSITSSGRRMSPLIAGSYTVGAVCHWSSWMTSASTSTPGTRTCCGGSVVRPRGDLVLVNRSLIPARTPSGQPSPHEELTDTTAPSGIRATASLTVRTRTFRISVTSSR